MAVVAEMAMQKGQEGEGGGIHFVEDNEYEREGPGKHLLTLKRIREERVLAIHE
jgi:hypothetical protein